MAPQNARIIARTIVAAEVDGSRSHGIQRLAGYIGSLDSRWVDGDAAPEVEDCGASLVRVDARNGFAQVALAAAFELLLGKARQEGLAMLAIRDSHHFASLWPDVEPFAQRGFVALTTVNSRSRMVAWGGKRKVLGTNPIAFACPRKGRLPLVFDQASSVMSQGDVLLHASRGDTLPHGVGVDKDGNPTIEPRAVLDGGALLPFSGAKGSSIAFMVEILAAALTGGKFGFEDTSGAFPGAQTSNAGQFLLLIDPHRVVGEVFSDRVEHLIAELTAAGSDRMPGDQRYHRRAAAQSNGIQLDERSIAEIARLSGEDVPGRKSR